ncbi:TfuA-like protein [Pyxidicoccus caerfyrddinensis]|uniref:TfuA-like protein n=1 Tax=Pyxidicoccus caerfyrddinensis TaxID=2709663 RepID=UPI0013D912F2|nr:TfuA-like protein [Pyxidicoccus caerfyrddinensis]
MTKVFIFTGPTLRPEEARAELEAVYLPPVQQGDVYRAAREGPVAIGIIDGFFEHVPAVWHKEILWAMSEGIHVFGAASMGALRAAELEAFGMEGVGAIFDAFQRGELEDDDDVAVAHGGEEDGWRPLSEAMVNISATLSAAWVERVVSQDTTRTLEQVAKGLFYVERAWPVLLARGAREGVPASQLKAFEAWLPTGRVDQKKADALALLRTMRERLEVGLSPKTVSFPFQHTDAWEEARRRAGRLPLRKDTRPLEGVAPESLLDELRLRGELGAARRSSMARALAVEQARRLGREPGEDELRSTAEALRQERGLEPESFERWQAEQQVDDLGRLLRDESHVRWVETLFEPDVLRHLADHLRLTGEYAGLLERARDKERVLTAAGLATPRPEDAGITEDMLWRWYFEERQGRMMPESLGRAARDGGFSDVDSMRRAALRELCYVLAKAEAPE